MSAINSKNYTTKTKKPYPGYSKSQGPQFDDETMERMLAEYGADQYRLTELFWADVADELGIAKGDPFFSAFRRLVWSHSHQNGLNGVYFTIDEHRELIDLYLTKK